MSDLHSSTLALHVPRTRWEVHAREWSRWDDGSTLGPRSGLDGPSTPETPVRETAVLVSECRFGDVDVFWGMRHITVPWIGLCLLDGFEMVDSDGEVHESGHSGA